MRRYARYAAVGLLSLVIPGIASAQDAKDQAPPPPVTPNPAAAATPPDAPAPPGKPIPPSGTPVPAVAPDAAVPPDPATPPPHPVISQDHSAPLAAQAASPADQPISGNPNLSVATVKMDGGLRASRVIGAGVTNGSNQEVGSVSDLILDKQGKVVLGVISVGGIMGVGGKLVAVPYGSLHIDDAGKVTLPDGSKESLNKMPGFTYNN